MKRILIMLGFVFFGLFVNFGSSSALVSDSNKITGQIVDIDEQRSLIVVKWLNQRTTIYDEITIFVPSNAEIYRGTETVSLMELNLFDNVDVEYYNDSPGPLKAIRIFVQT